jgi:hypothetical protein
MTTYDEVIHIAERLTLAEKARLMAYLSTSLQHDLETEAYKHMPWQQFLDRTYGSLALDPLERDQPLSADIRDEIE